MIQIGSKFIEKDKLQKKEEKKEVPFDHNIDFLVDPFFKKTTQMFDETSSKGMLLNNLLINPNHMLTLDSQDQNREFIRQDAKQIPKAIKTYKDMIKKESLVELQNSLA